MKKNRKIVLLLLLIVFLFQANLALAFEIKYPSLPGVPSPTPGNIPSYVRYIFNLSLIVVTIICIGVMIFGGVLHLVSGAKPVALVSAKNWIFSGLLGLLILLSSYLLLVVINPQLTIFHLPGLEEPLVTPQPEWPELEIVASPYVQLPVETSIKRILCQEHLCKEELSTSTKLIRCKREPEPQAELERCFCKKVEFNEKYLTCNVQATTTEATSTCILDAILIISECFTATSKEINEILAELAEELQTLVEECECDSCPDCICPENDDPDCECIGECENCGCPCEGECPCKKCLEVNPGEDPCPNRGEINTKRQEIQDFLDSVEYQNYKELELELEKLRCELLNELVKSKKLDNLIKSCGTQSSAVQAINHDEFLVNLTEAEKAGAQPVETKKLLEWETAELFDPPARVVDAPTTFYCPKTEEWGGLHQDVRSYLIWHYLPQFIILPTCLELSPRLCIPVF